MSSSHIHNLPIRLATPDDAEVITAQRRNMVAAIMTSDPTILDAISRQYPDWVRPRLEAGEYLGWLAVDGEQVVAGAGLWLIDWPFHPQMQTGKRPYLLNVFVDPQYRRRGLARQLVTAAVDYCRTQGYGVVYLHASDEGRPMYEAMGFQPSSEMILNLK